MLLLFVHFLFSIAAVIFYSAFVAIVVKDNQDIYWLYLFYVSAALFDITWLFYGLENFKSVVAKNLLCKIAVFTTILFFVQKPSDLPIYTFIETISLVLSNILLFPFVFRHVKPIRFGFKDCLEHLKPMLILSISVIASSLYTVFDKTLLGIMTTKENVAYYEYSNKILLVPKAFVSVIATVLFPKACSLASKGDYDGRAKYANYAYVGLSAISFASIFGLLSVGRQFAVLYYGTEFAICGDLIIALSPIIFIIGLGDIVRNVFLIPQKKDLPYVVCLCLNAMVNLVLTFIFIPRLGIYGAIIGTTAAELFGLVFQCIYCRKEISFSAILKSVLTFFFVGFLMFSVLKIYDSFVEGQSLYHILFKILVGIVSFVLFSMICIKIVYKDLWTYLTTSIKKKVLKKERTHQ